MTRRPRIRASCGFLGWFGCALLFALFSSLSPAWTQEQPSAKELMGRAQSQSEKKAVEDLIEKLQPRPAQKAKPPDTAGDPSRQGVKAEESAKPAISTPRPAAAAPSKEPTEEKPREAAVTPAAKELGDAKSREDSEPGGGSQRASTETPATTTKTSSEEQTGTPNQQPPTPTMEAKPGLAPEKIVEQAAREQLPSVDLEVLFEYNSAELTPQAVEALTPLGLALSDARLADGRFLIAGHTDAKGGSAYNRRLSQRRAEAVRQFLIVNFKIKPSSLVARGFGEKHLKVPQDPLAAQNRRVQVVNFKQTAR